LITPIEACRAWEEAGDGIGPGITPIFTYGEVKDASRIAQLFAGVEAVILGVERIDESVLHSCTRLKIISRFGIGYDAIDLEALQRRQIRLAITRGCMPYAVARQTIAFLMAMTFNLFDHNRRLKEGEWARIANSSCPELTLGIVGLGSVGREVAMLARALGYNVAAFNRSPARCEGVYISGSLRELIQRSDVVSLHVALTPETRGLVSGDVVNWLLGKSLINTARGGVVSEWEILEALNKGLLRYYATDVFSSEPIEGVSRDLARHERVVCTPHVGAFDRVTARLMLRQAVSNLVHCVNGEHEAVNAYVL